MRPEERASDYCGYERGAHSGRVRGARGWSEGPYLRASNLDSPSELWWTITTSPT